MQIEEYDLSPLVAPALAWYRKNRRDLPWRRDRDPYHIWVSEIMLQQTRVEAVIPYYERFLETLPDVWALAVCPEERLLKLWEGLGYYNRVRNMQRAAATICAIYGGKMPKTYEEICALSGIGPYTAGAIASIAYDLPTPAVDGNVLRILMRVCEDDADVAKDAVRKKITRALEGVMPSEAGTFNQALMEIGALVCLPNGAPHCTSCPWQEFCGSYAHGSCDSYPVRTRAKARRIEERTVLLIRDGEKVVIHKRPKEGLLAGLYELPNVEGYLQSEEVTDLVSSHGFAPLRVERLAPAKHIFSHIEWKMEGYLVRVADVESFPKIADLAEDYVLAEIADIRKHYPVPSAFDAYMRAL